MQKRQEKLSLAVKYGVAAILLAVPLYPKFPFIRIPGTYVSIRLEDFLIAAVTLVAFIYVLPEAKKIIGGEIEKAIFLFLFIAAVSLASGVLLTQTVPLHIGILHWLRRLEYFLPFFIGVSILKRNDSTLLEFFLKVLMVVVVLAFVYGFGQKELGWPVIITQNEEYSKGTALRWVAGSHVNATFAGHYDLATFLILALPIFVTLFFVIRDIPSRIALGVVVFSGLWLLVNAVSRISIISYLIGTIIALILAKKYRAIPVVFCLSLLFFSFSADLWSRYIRLFDVTFQKIQKVKLFYEIAPVAVYAEEILSTRRSRIIATPTPAPVFEDRSTSIRLNVEWPRAIRAFSKNPILGTGFSSITLATDNDFLRLLGEVGILGFLSFGLIFVKIGNLGLTNFPFTDRFDGVQLAFVSGMGGAMFGILLNALFIDVFEASKFAIVFWLLTGMFVSLLRERVNE